MKTTAFFLAGLISLFSLQVAAQTVPVITEDVFPPVGDSVVFQPINSAFDPGSDGTNVTWNYSTVISGGTPLSEVVEDTDRSVVPAADSFPEANQAYSPTLFYDAFYQLTDSQYVIDGYDYPDLIHYWDGETFLKFPFTYNSSFTDSFHADVLAAGYTRRGKISVVADAYGMLTLPHGTYSNVLRVKFTEKYVDDDGAGDLINYVTIIYNWYKPGVVGALLTHTLEANDNGDTSEVYGYNTHIIATGIKEESSQIDLKVFPNPVTNQLFISTQEKWSEYSISDISGQIVERGILNNSGLNSISLAKAPAGMYFFQLQTNSGAIVTKKVIVSK